LTNISGDHTAFIFGTEAQAYKARMRRFKIGINDFLMLRGLFYDVVE
jgi:hypothetical protein